MDNFLVLNIHNLGSTSENRNPERASTDAAVFSQQIFFEKVYPSSEKIKIESDLPDRPLNSSLLIGPIAEYFQCG
jgi:hypothetical protein